MDTSLEPAGATATAVPTAAADTDPVTVYLARLTSAESRRAMDTSLELLAELLVDGHPADERSAQEYLAAIGYPEEDER
jgi:hypothetical protein